MKSPFQWPLWARISSIALVLVGAIAFGGFLWIVLGPGPTDFAGKDRVTLAAFHGGDPTGVPQELKGQDLIARGEYLARAADCEACHTAKGGKPYAGGLAFVLPFGTLYSTNITPDNETGIGKYSDAAFLDSVHRGIRADGAWLYPAMPYPSYTYITDADALAIKAYLFSLSPVHAPAPANTLGFPFNQRWLMGFWAYLFNSDKRFEPHSERSAEWNRGAYLVEAMAHCGECHTPRNLMQALDNRNKFAGSVQAGWRAYNITSDRTSGIGEWSDTDLFQYLAEGHAWSHGTASGPMGEAVDKSLSYLTRSDVGAIIAYLRTIPQIPSSDLHRPRTEPAPLETSAALQSNLLGKKVYEGACAGCHGWTGQSPVLSLATFSGARAINDPTAMNVAQIVLSGTQRRGGAVMPGFGATYSDTEIAAVANYVTARFGAQPSATTAADVAKLRASQ